MYLEIHKQLLGEFSDEKRRISHISAPVIEKEENEDTVFFYIYMDPKKEPIKYEFDKEKENYYLYNDSDSPIDLHEGSKPIDTDHLEQYKENYFPVDLGYEIDQDRKRRMEKCDGVTPLYKEGDLVFLRDTGNLADVTSSNIMDDYPPKDRYTLEVTRKNSVKKELVPIRIVDGPIKDPSESEEYAYKLDNRALNYKVYKRGQEVFLKNHGLFTTVARANTEGDSGSRFHIEAYKFPGSDNDETFKETVSDVSPVKKAKKGDPFNPKLPSQEKLKGYRENLTSELFRGSEMIKTDIPKSLKFKEGDTIMVYKEYNKPRWGRILDKLDDGSISIEYIGGGVDNVNIEDLEKRE